MKSWTHLGSCDWEEFFQSVLALYT